MKKKVKKGIEKNKKKEKMWNINYKLSTKENKSTSNKL
jgi:hypothetical protein